MKRILVISAFMLLAACGKQQYAGLQQCGTDQNGNQNCVAVPQGQVAQQYAPQAIQGVQQPVYVQQPSQPVIVQDNSGSNMVAGMAIGMMAGHAMSGGSYYDHRPGYSDNSSYNKTVINKTVIVNNHPAPIIAAGTPAPRVTQSVSIPPSRPSVSSSSSFSRSSSSSFGGFSRRR